MSSVNIGNNNMKQCSSLTSLRQGVDASPDQNSQHSKLSSPAVTTKNNNERLYHSLNKRPKKRPAWLDSPGGSESSGYVDTAMAQNSRDEFWAAIQPDYNYLMGRQLIDSCCQEWLANSSQSQHLTIGGDKFSVSQLQQPLQQQPPDGSGLFSDVETELGGIKQWLMEAEVKIGPGVTEWRDFRDWGKPGVPHALQRDAKMLDHKALHREIESRGRVLSALLRLCEQLEKPDYSGEHCDLPPHRRARAAKLAQRLHKRWQILFLKNLEWILHLETATSSADGHSDSSDSLSDESVTPVRKKRMLTAPEQSAGMSPEIGCSDKGSDCPDVATKAPIMGVLEPMDFLDFEAQMYFNRSGRSKVANSAVFYFKHSTTEVSSNSSDNEDEEWTYTPNSGSDNKGARTKLNFDSPQHEEQQTHHRTSEVVDSTSGEASEETSEPPSSPSPSSSQHLSECSPSPSSEDLHTSVATCIGQSPEKVVMRPKRSPQRVKRRPVSLPFSLLSPESLAVTPTNKTCSDTNLATLSRKKRTMRRSKRRLQQASQSSESEDLMSRLAVLNQVSGIIKSSSFSGTCNVNPNVIPDGSYSDPTCKPVVHIKKSVIRPCIPRARVKDVTEESGEPSWDSYQERYNSEAYSEDIDAETARRLLEFGDDYSRYLREEFSDSSTNKRPSSSTRRRRDLKLPPLAPDSDSEVEELRYVLKLSQDSLSYTSQRLQEAMDKFNELVCGMHKMGPENMLNVGELAEMAATCRESKKCVALVISRIEQDAAGIADLDLIFELLERWEDLEAKTQELQRTSTLARQVASLRQAIASVTSRQAELSIAHKVRNQHSRLECRLTLQLKLAAIKDQLAMMSDIKYQLSDTNMLIHRLSTEDNGTYRQHIKSMLKVQIAELYELWDQTNSGLETELQRTQEHLVAWEELDRQLSSLRGSLLRDREVLLSGGRSKEISDCGSLSDSGISDAGSDVLEVREKELTSLRALANQLPLQTRQDIVHELDAAEKELEQLRLYSSQRNLATTLEPMTPVTRKAVAAAAMYSNSIDGDSKVGSSGPRYWLKFVPMCLVTLLALVCSLLQPPNCCEYVNRGAGQYLEQLRFQNGPPPV